MTAPSNQDAAILELLAGATSGKFRKVQITPETQLQSGLGLDSIAILSLVFRFEEMFGVDLTKLGVSVDISGLRTAGDILKTARSVLERVPARNGK
jgi:acyl carrier protein